jgi:hypothetical protein
MMDITQNEVQAEERLPWHKPEIERLEVTLDTRSGLGSGPDGAGRTRD